MADAAVEPEQVTLTPNDEEAPALVAPADSSTPLWKKIVCELLGTMVLVFFGCGSASLPVQRPDLLPGSGEAADRLSISVAFGLAIVYGAYAIGPVSGCHVNPAVSLSCVVGGRMSIKDMAGYWVGQFAGGIIGAAILYGMAQGSEFEAGNGLGGMGANGFGPGYLGEYNMTTAVLFEIFATFLFTLHILGATHPNTGTEGAGMTIGLVLIVIHIVGIPVTGVSVNPARSLGPAMFAADPKRLEQVWVFFIGPLVGGMLAGLFERIGVCRQPIKK